jgi:uncharacterized protein
VSSIKPTFRRILLALLSLFSLLFIAQSLFSTVDLPQAPTLVDLLQTDLSLQASAWKTKDSSWAELAEIVIEKDATKAYQQALESYLEVRQSNLSENPISDLELGTPKKRTILPKESVKSNALSSNLSPAKETSLNELDLRIGILQALTKNEPTAQKTWNQIIARSPEEDLAETAKVLQKLWHNPIPILSVPETEIAQEKINENLDRWSKSLVLERLYRHQLRFSELNQLLDQRQIDAQRAFTKIISVAAIPLVAGSAGCLLWLGLLAQRLFSSNALLKFGDRQQASSLISWGAEKTWEVMVLWFSSYVAISFLLPLLLVLVNSKASKIALPFSSQTYQAVMGVFIPYCITMLPMLPIIEWSLPKSSQSLAESSSPDSFSIETPIQLPSQTSPPQTYKWLNLSFKPSFQSGKWILWGIGGYLAAVPLVLIASTLSEKIWQGQGGSNPLLPILTESQDSLAKLILWATLAIAAPFFEEYLFRGFFLSSLVKLMPIPFALLLSGFCFATVHLNLGDILPLTVLGIVLGFVYYKSRNLLASILLHCLWNSASFVSLLALGS